MDSDKYIATKLKDPRAPVMLGGASTMNLMLGGSNGRDISERDHRQAT